MLACTGSASHIGGRDEQQDRVAVQVMSNSTLLVVADGMGGHKDGVVAAEILVDSACRAHKKLQGNISDPKEFFNKVVKDSWQQIREYAGKHKSTPHTTAVMALVFSDLQAAWAHIGDARLYRLRNQQPPWRTADHSVVQMLFMEGKISEEEMADHPDQNRLWRSIGGDKFYEPKSGGAATPLSVGEILLLCSDGLWEQMEPAEMFEIVSTMPPPEAAEKMVSLAAKRGGDKGDNVSVALWAR